MLIRTLVENTTLDHQLRAEHGLSLYIESGGERMLFDLGGGTLFLENAQKMGIDLAKIDRVIISHGHNDHGGGLRTFLETNKTAKVYLQKNAFDPHFSFRSERKIDIGLDPTLMADPRIILTEDFYQINENCVLFSGVPITRYFPSMNQNLYKLAGTELLIDDFDHEQNLIVQEESLSVVFIGCAHRGVVNILDEVRNRMGKYPTHVIGGFHMSSRSSGVTEDPETIVQVAQYFKKTNCRFFTGHCTGEIPYRIIKKIIGKKLQKITTGKTLLVVREESI